MKNWLRNNWKGIIRWLIVLNSIWWMFAVAPFGFLFPELPKTQLIRVLTIFFSTILLLYLLRDKRKNRDVSEFWQQKQI